jgi:GNAT superfamily N-acetyltransferase
VNLHWCPPSFEICANTTGHRADRQAPIFFSAPAASLWSNAGLGRRSTVKAKAPRTIKEAKSERDIRRCFPVMKELRPHLPDAADLVARARRQKKAVGWRLIYVEDDGQPVACASFRVYENLSAGKVFYVDDLVALPTHRGQGYADALLLWLLAEGWRQGCNAFHLDSGTHRLPAHRFYHRMGLAITSFHFARPLEAQPQRAGSLRRKSKSQP